jgi:hypothetical protein
VNDGVVDEMKKDQEEAKIMRQGGVHFLGKVSVLDPDRIGSTAG